ncbi:MAG: hypothetical protein ABQ298_03575 [Puniceicoccaceae bacterium]
MSSKHLHWMLEGYPYHLLMQKLSARPLECAPDNVVALESTDVWALPSPENLSPAAWEAWVSRQQDRELLRGYLLYFHDRYCVTSAPRGASGAS